MVPSKGVNKMKLSSAYNFLSTITGIKLSANVMPMIWFQKHKLPVTVKCKDCGRSILLKYAWIDYDTGSCHCDNCINVDYN